MKNTQRFFKYCYLITSLLFVADGLSQDLEVQSNLTNSKWVNRYHEITLSLSRALPQEEGRLVAFIGTTDVTGLFVQNGTSWKYSPYILPLPGGDSELILSVIGADGGWQEVARFPLRVRNMVGLEKSSILPQVSINNSGQVAEGHTPEDNGPERETYQDFTGQGSLSTEHSRGGVTFRSNWELVGASEQDQTLRFSEKGDDAAKIDLSNYLMALEKGANSISLGNISHGRQKHLINFYGSRGLLLRSEIGSRFDISAAAMNATNIVGWNNFAGLNESNHRINSGTVGLNLVQGQAGALRVEGSAVDASSLPLNNFNQGVINDAEESNGYGFRVEASGLGQRVNFEGGFARSKFVNPEDPFLAQDEDLVEVQSETKNAQYANFNLGLLENVSLSESWQANVNLGLRHERVDPLYRSLTAFTRSDYLENAVDLQASLGLVSVQYSHNRSEDNLDEVESILKTKTRVNAFNIALPLPYIITAAGGTNAWLPTISYNFNRVHQFGDELPVNGGFSDGHVPDQMSNSHNAGLDWQADIWQFGYFLSYNLQDNRQPGRETADFENVTNSINLGVNPFSRLSLSFDIGFENAENKGIDRTDLTKVYGLNLNLQTTGASNFSLNYSNTNTEDNDKTSEQNNANLNAQWSLNFRLKKAQDKDWVAGQVFIRYARSEADSRDVIFGFEDEFDNWTLNTGVNLTVF